MNTVSPMNRIARLVTEMEEREMRLIYRQGRVEIYEVSEAHGTDYYVYGVTNSGDPVVCPSIGMARAIAVG